MRKLFNPNFWKIGILLGETGGSLSKTMLKYGVEEGSIAHMNLEEGSEIGALVASKTYD